MRRHLFLSAAIAATLVCPLPTSSALSAASSRALPQTSVVLSGKLVDERGVPLVGVEILVADGDQNAAWALDSPAIASESNEQEPLRRFRSDEQGLFRIEELKPGLVRVALRAPGRELRDLAITVNETADLGTLTLSPGCTLRGRIHSHAGTAVRDATLFSLQPETSLPHAHPWTGSVLGSTDREGLFELKQLPPGPFCIAIEAAGEPPYRVRGFVIDDLDLGEIRLPAPSSISGVVEAFPLGELSDLIVVALPTRAVPFAERPNGQRGQRARWLEGYATTTIGEHGIFALHGLLPETYYSLRVLAPEDFLRVQDAWSPPRLVQSGTKGIVLTAHPSVRIDFEVIDARTELPLAEFEHTWFGARSLPRRGVDYLRATDENRRVILQVNAPGYALYQSDPLALVAGNPLVPLRVPLVPREARIQTLPEPEALDRTRRDPWNRASLIDSLPGFEEMRRPLPELTPNRPKATGAQLEVVRGQVSVSKQPLVGAVLRLYPPSSPEQFFALRHDAITTARTGRDGHFWFGPLATGEYTLSIEHESRALPALRSIRVSPATKPLSFQLESLELHGRVVDATGIPVAGAEIHLPDHWKRETRFGVSDGDGDRNVIHWRDLQSPTCLARTDASGEFVLSGLEPGTLTVGARKAEVGVGTLRIAQFDRQLTLMLSSNSSLIVYGFDSKPGERALGLAWRWGRDYAHEMQFAFERAHGTRFSALSADEWTVFQAELDGWGEVSTLRVLAPALLDPVGESTIRLHR